MPVQAPPAQDPSATSIPARRYHHGDLRAALVEAGLALLVASSGEAPGLREVARAVGVSSAAVYRHFPNREALLRALALAGLEQLGAAQTAAMQAGGTTKDAFNASGRAYVRFALANPSLYRLIFATAGATDRTDLPGNDNEPGRLLLGSVARLYGDRLSADGQRIVALRAWAIVHGLAMLALDGVLDAGMVAAELDRLVDSQGFAAGLA